MSKSAEDPETPEAKGDALDVPGTAVHVLTLPVRVLNVPLFSNAFFLMLNTGASAAIGAAFWFVAARFYPAREVGLAAAVIPLISFLAGAATLGLGIGLIRFLPENLDDSSRARGTINTCLTISGGLGGAFALAFLVGVEWWAPRLAFLLSDPLLAIGFILLPAVLALRLIHMQLYVALRKVNYAFASSLIGGVRVPLSLLFLGAGGSLGLVASYGVGMFLAFVAGALLFLPWLLPGYRPIPSARLKLLRPMARFSLGNHMATLVASILPALLPLMVLEMRSPTENAWFYVAWFLGSMLYTVSGSLSTSLFAEGSQVEVNLVRDLRRTALGSVVLLAPAGSVLWFVGDSLLRIFGEGYSAGGFVLLRWMVLAAPFVLVNQVYFTLVRIAKRVVPIIAGNGFVAVLTLGFSFYLLPKMGLVAIGVAYLLSQGVFSGAAVLHLLQGRLGRGVENEETKSR